MSGAWQALGSATTHFGRKVPAVKVLARRHHANSTAEPGTFRTGLDWRIDELLPGADRQRSRPMRNERVITGAEAGLELLANRFVIAFRNFELAVQCGV